MTNVSPVRAAVTTTSDSRNLVRSRKSAHVLPEAEQRTGTSGRSLDFGPERRVARGAVYQNGTKVLLLQTGIGEKL